MWFSRWWMESLHGPHDGLHYLGFAANTVGGRRHMAVMASSSGVRCLPDDTENDQRGSEQGAEGNHLATFGFEKIEKVLRVHGRPLGGRTVCTGALVMTIGGGGGDRRFTSTMN